MTIIDCDQINTELHNEVLPYRKGTATPSFDTVEECCVAVGLELHRIGFDLSDYQFKGSDRIRAKIKQLMERKP
jgi:hypothetical protein